MMVWPEIKNCTCIPIWRSLKTHFSSPFPQKLLNKPVYWPNLLIHCLLYFVLHSNSPSPEALTGGTILQFGQSGAGIEILKLSLNHSFSLPNYSSHEAAS